MGLIDEGSWSDSENDSNSDSNDDEGPHVANIYLMAIDHHELDISEVFNFDSPDVDIFDLRTDLCDITSKLHKYMKWFRVLSRDQSILQEEKEKVQLELEII